MKPLFVDLIGTVHDSTDQSNNFPSTSNVQSKTKPTELYANRQQECERLIEVESMDFKPSATDYNSECESDGRSNHAFDDDLNSDDTSKHSENFLAKPPKQQLNNEGKPSRNKTKQINKTKTKQKNEKAPSNQLYSCKMCDRTFGCSTNLKKHEFVHTDTRPFQCPLCSKS